MCVCVCSSYRSLIILACFVCLFVHQHIWNTCRNKRWCKYRRIIILFSSFVLFFSFTLITSYYLFVGYCNIVSIWNMVTGSLCMCVLFILLMPEISLVDCSSFNGFLYPVCTAIECNCSVECHFTFGTCWWCPCSFNGIQVASKDFFVCHGILEKKEKNRERNWLEMCSM